MAAILPDPSTRQHNPSLLVQLLKEVPHRLQRNKLVEDVAAQVDANVPTARFPASTSKLAGRGSGAGPGAGAAVGMGSRGSGGSWGGVDGAKLARRGGSRVIGMGGVPKLVGCGDEGVSGAPGGWEMERGRTTLPGISSVRSSKRAVSAEKAVVQVQQPLHLPTIKRPSLSSELRRRVLLNASTALREREEQLQEQRVRSPARAGSRSSLRSGNGRGKGGKGSLKGTVSVAQRGVGTGTGDVTRLVKGMCTTADESVVREKVRKILREDEQVGKLNVDHQRKEEEEEEGEPTYTTGTATRNLRRYFTHQKISHKKKVLERAFGWHSQVLDVEANIDVQMGRFAARNQDGTSPVPIGESASGSEFVGAIKVAGSIGSKDSNGVYLLREAGEWVDEEEEDVDTVMMRDGTVRKGRRGGQFQLDQNQIPPTPLSKSKRRTTRPPRASNTNRNPPLPPASPPSTRPTLPAPAKRSLQRFDRVEDWLDHQRDHSEDPSATSHPSLVNISTQTAHPTTPKAPLLRPPRKSHHTPSAASLERRYPLSLAHLPYLKHNLKAGVGKGGSRGGGVVTISPPTGEDQLGYIHLDLRGKRELYTIVPGSGAGSGGNGESGKFSYTMVIVHPRKEEDDSITESTQSRENVYSLSELPQKHLRVVAFASKFIGIVRRETVVVRIEGLNSPNGIGNGSVRGKNVQVGQMGKRSRWEWYRAEVYADGRFVFMVVPRGGVLGSRGPSRPQSQDDDGVGEEGEEEDGAVMLGGGVVKITFSTTASVVSGGGEIGSGIGIGNTSGIIPRFIGGNGKGIVSSKLKKAYVEITRTLVAGEMSKPTGVDFVWVGVVELGPGSAPDGNVVGAGGVDMGEVCAGFAAEVDWARRMWIECRKVADKRR
ncbi:hypothetical protein EV426DRAFT_206830 [Tirmania nivea]|nr:hypothetical protein EV426DRAFT_206830 [Tirmania nivea]